MKKIFNISLIALGLLTTSCNNDLLDTYSPGALTEDVAIQNSSDLQMLLNSAYSIMGNRSESAFVSVFTDEVGIGFANGGQGVNDTYVFFLNSGSDGPTALWGNPYLAMARINRVIEFADRITPKNPQDAEKIADIKAQALTLRAYGHLKVLSYFTTDMKNDAALAGILADRIFEADENDIPRSTNGEFYSFIHNDLNQAISLFASAPSVPISSSYANINFARGLKARAYAYKGDYVNAETWANTVISTSNIPLAIKAEYRNLFFMDAPPANGPELIFKFNRLPLQNNQDTNLHNAWVSLRPNEAGSPFYEVSRALHNKLNPASLPANTLLTQLNDVRANVIIAPSSVIDPNYATSANYRNTDRIIINKHGGVATGANTWATTGTQQNNNSFKIMRISEMYLILAEARAAQSDFAGAAANVKIIRDARTETSQFVPTPANATEAWKMILDERRIEFAFEGYRFIDLKRLGTLANSGIDRDPADYSSSTMNYPAGNPANLPLSSHKWALPIPTLETNVNSAIQQNPGY